MQQTISFLNQCYPTGWEVRMGLLSQKEKLCEIIILVYCFIQFNRIDQDLQSIKLQLRVIWIKTATQES